MSLFRGYVRVFTAALNETGMGILFWSVIGRSVFWMDSHGTFSPVVKLVKSKYNV